jgi:hypothetical protein
VLAKPELELPDPEADPDELPELEEPSEEEGFVPESELA